MNRGGGLRLLFVATCSGADLAQRALAGWHRPLPLTAGLLRAALRCRPSSSTTAIRTQNSRSARQAPLSSGGFAQPHVYVFCVRTPLWSEGLPVAGVDRKAARKVG
jgi:hypothetical protein